MELPLCLEEYKPELSLTFTERRALIQTMAEHGPSTIGKFISERVDDKQSGIAKLVKKLRWKFEAQVNRTRERIERRYKKHSERIRQKYGSEFDKMDDNILKAEDGSMLSSESYVDSNLNSRLVKILANDDVLNFIINLEEIDEEDIKETSIWFRIKDAIRRAIAYLVELVRRFINWLRRSGKHADEISQIRQRRKSGILIRYPSGTKLMDDIDHNLNNALATSPKFRRVIDRELNLQGGKKLPSNRRVTWKKYFEPEEYDQEVRKLVNQRIKRAIKREQRKLASEYKQKKRRALKRLKARQDKTHQEVRERETEAQIKQIEKQRSAEIKKLKEQTRNKIQRSVRAAVVNELEDAGLVQKDDSSKPKITSRLIDRFAEIVLSDEIKKLPSKFSYSATALTHGKPQGVYEKKKLQSVYESSRMDIVESLINSRISHPQHRHIYDSDIITHSEMRSNVSHVILIFDKSGSMEENNRILAAKKSVLALYKAVKHRNSQNIVDFIAFDSRVHVMDLLSAWRSTPSGFTNTGEALLTAHEILKDSYADRKLVYLITDGLPEAFTDPQTGEPRAGDLEKSLKIAVKQAKKFKKYTDLRFTIILLEPKEDVYTSAAETLAQASGGSVIVTDPQELATEMLMDYIEL
jgi:Mg-chelatase subunit ChlD